jgi:hypothetical protein
MHYSQYHVAESDKLHALSPLSYIITLPICEEINSGSPELNT